MLLDSQQQALGTPNVTVFLTHHHHDHVEGLNVVSEVFPNSSVIAHGFSLGKLTDLYGLKGASVCEYTAPPSGVERFPELPIVVGNVKVSALYCPGHTIGHMGLWLHDSRFDAWFCGHPV